jgi:hypothetical protein
MIDIAHRERLENLFGHWPDFHDAEVLALRIDMSGHGAPALEVEFDVAEMSEDVDERGYYRDRQRARTTLRFERVANLKLEGIYVQNVVFEMLLEPAGSDDFDEVMRDEPVGRRSFRVSWSSSLGMAANFLCNRVEVLKASQFARAT